MSKKETPAQVDLLSYTNRSRRPKKKKRNVKLIVTNVILSAILVVSSVTLTGMAVLNSSLFKKTTIDQQEKGDFKDVVTSINGNVSYFLIVGTDLSEDLTDIMMVGCYDLANNSLNILQLPRDTYTGSEAGYTKKLNAVYQNARSGESKIKALIRSVNARFGLPIDHYVTVTIPGFRNIIDAIGGLDITLDKAFRIEDSRPTDTGGAPIPITIGPGKVHLKGYEAEGLIRNRKDSPDGSDIGRIKNQRTVYAAIAKKMTSIGFNEVKDIVINCSKDVSSDLKVGEMLGYAQKLNQLDLNKIKISAVPGQFYNKNGQSYFAAHKQAYLDLINADFRPYESSVLTKDDITLEEPQSSNDNDLFGDDDDSLGDFDTQKDKVTNTTSKQ